MLMFEKHLDFNALRFWSPMVHLESSASFTLNTLQDYLTSCMFT